MRSDLSLVNFEKKHYETYQKLINSCFFQMRYEIGIKPYLEYCDTLEETLKQSHNIYLYINEDDELIAAITFDDNKITNVAVGLAHQGQGIGRRIVEFAISRIQAIQSIRQTEQIYHKGRAEPKKPINLTVAKWNKNAVGLYLSMGFAIVKETEVKGVCTQDEEGNWIFDFVEKDGLDMI